MQTLEIDTRQHDGKHQLKHDYFNKSGIHCVRTKLYVGDYRYVGGRVCVDTKASFQEIHTNVTIKHDTFVDECIRAREAGYALVVLIENVHGVQTLNDLSRWIEPNYEFKRRKGGKRRIKGETLAKTFNTFHQKYNVYFDFCAPKEAGARVLELLDREQWFLEQMKEVEDGGEQDA